MPVISLFMQRSIIELLAPAKNLECGIAAINHGADAVYIGSPQFGARKAAANTIDDIATLVRHAHTFGARVHVALNTLLFDNEVADARSLAWKLYDVGVDVLIVQDAALLIGDMPPIELHASTQCDNRSADKVLFWQQMGLAQVVLARELSVKEIADIARQTTVRLEAFVHGALCVSYSGQCYMSLLRGGRSANRGECAQPCRLAYDVTAADGSCLLRHTHALSLRDNNQSDNLEQLIDAGVSSFKIEGRLKDADYVSNITLFYRQRLDEILARRPDLQRLSRGSVSPGFTPSPYKSFNRGFTDYFAHGRQPDIWQPQTSKSIGEPLGKVSSVGKNDSFDVRTDLSVSNGDGLCFFGRNGLMGVKVNTAQNVAKGVVRINAQNAAGVRVGDTLWRNADMAFADVLKHDKTRRAVDVSLSLDFADGSFSLSVSDSDGVSTTFSLSVATDEARNADSSRRMFSSALSKMGGTPYNASSVSVSDAAASRFAPASAVNELRRDALVAHTEARIAHFRPSDVVRQEAPDARFPKTELRRDANVINNDAKLFYESHGSKLLEWGYERQGDSHEVRVMTMRHCILNSLGKCLRKHPECARLVPLTLTDPDGRRYEARPECRLCQMAIFSI